MKRAWQAWDRFWFGSSDLLLAGVFRFYLGLTLLALYIVRHLDLDFLLTDAGPMKADAVIRLVPEFFKSPLYWFPQTDLEVKIWHSVFLLGLLLLTLGVLGRWLAVGVFVLHLAFMQRNPSVAYGADIVATFWLLYLCLISNSRRFSLEAWIRKAPTSESARSAIFTSVGLRLVQIQLCIIYAYSGLEKLKGMSWWDGSALWTVLGNRNLMVWDLSFLQAFPFVVAIVTFATVIFEVYFPALIWVRPVRRYLVWAGLGLHAGIGVLMGLPFFSSLMMAAYIPFLDSNGLRAAFSRVLPRRLLAIGD